MGTCNFELSDGSLCGLPCHIDSHEGIYETCKFHSTSNLRFLNDPVYYKLLKEYVNEKDRKFIDLSKLQFIDFTFKSEIFSNNLDLHFDLTYFKNCNFSNLKIRRDISFNFSIFDETSFNEVKIKCNNINFNGSQFKGAYSPFTNCCFQANKEILFSSTEFRLNITPFLCTQLISPKVDFSRCYVESKRLSIRLAPHPDLHKEFEVAPRIFDDRSLVISSNDISFDRMLYSNNFELIQFLKEKDHFSRLELTLINFSSMNSAVFINVNLKETYFLYSVIDSIRFIKTTWEIRDKVRKIIYDEIEPFKDEDFTPRLRDLIELYIQLKKNYEQSHNYIDAGDWHYREMELRREDAKEKVWKGAVSFLSLSFYRSVSEYGENYLRPLLILFFLALFFPISYLIMGIRNSDIQIYHNICYINFLPFNICTFLIDYSHAFLFSLRAMTFQLSKDIYLENAGVKFVYTIQLLSTLIFVPLFLLALRRKFKR